MKYTVLPITYMGDEVLSKKTTPIEEITPDIVELAHNMAQTMYKSGGCGIAAPQVGHSLRLCVIDCEWDEKKESSKNPYFLINPQIVYASDETVSSSEGCLSFPGATISVERSRAVQVEAQNLEGELMRYSAEDSLLARCLQHEIDHLEGITMLDHAGPLARMRAIAKVKDRLAEANERGVGPWELD